MVQIKIHAFRLHVSNLFSSESAKLKKFTNSTVKSGCALYANFDLRCGFAAVRISPRVVVPRQPGPHYREATFRAIFAISVGKEVVNRAAGRR